MVDDGLSTIYIESITCAEYEWCFLLVGPNHSIICQSTTFLFSVENTTPIL